MPESKKRLLKIVCYLFYFFLVIAILIFTENMSFPQLGGVEKKEGVVIRLGEGYRDNSIASQREESPSKRSSSEKIDINSATKKELELLPGIGSTYAERIIENRPFCSLDELLHVSGIGAVTLSNIKEREVAFAESSSDCKDVNLLRNKEEKEEESDNKKVSQEGCLENSVDINSATKKELETLSGIGPVYAERIIKKRPFKDLDGLLNVSGIGEIRLKNIKSQGCAFVSPR